LGGGDILFWWCYDVVFSWRCGWRHDLGMSLRRGNHVGTSTRDGHKGSHGHTSGRRSSKHFHDIHKDT